MLPEQEAQAIENYMAGQLPAVIQRNGRGRPLFHAISSPESSDFHPRQCSRRSRASAPMCR